MGIRERLDWIRPVCAILALISTSAALHAKESAVTPQNFSLVWDAPWSIPKLALLAVFCFLAYTILSNSLFIRLLDRSKPGEACMMPQKAFKITLISILLVWTVLFAGIFGMTANQELRVSANVIPGGKTLFIVNYIDNYLFFFTAACLIALLVLYIVLPSGEEKANFN